MTPKTLRILQIDDSVADTALVEEVLASVPTPPEVLTCHSGREALELLHRLQGEARPDLILLDINMPGLGGHEVLALLKASPQWRDIPVVVRSVSGTPPDLRRSRERLAADHLVKPADLSGTETQLTELHAHWMAVLTAVGRSSASPPDLAARVQELHHAFLSDHGDAGFRLPQREALQDCFRRVPGLRQRVWEAWQDERRRAGVRYLAAQAWFDRAFPVAD